MIQIWEQLHHLIFQSHLTLVVLLELKRIKGISFIQFKVRGGGGHHIY